MIKINLTGDKSSSDLSAHFQVAVFFLSLVSIIVICWTYTSFLDFNIAYIKQAELALREQLTELKKETRTVRDLEKKREVLKSKLGVIRELKARKIGPVKLLDDLGKSVPEKSWLLEIRDKGGVLRIDGLALDKMELLHYEPVFRGNHSASSPAEGGYSGWSYLRCNSSPLGQCCFAYEYRLL
jgi:type IV pilus assembly protein PilN